MADLTQILSQIGPEIGQLLGITKPAIAGPPSGGAQATPPGAPGGPAPSPTMGQLFESPAVQGALTSYLSYLAAPRGENRWQRLGQAGLGGLQGYEQAEQRQTQLPMQQAQLQSAQAEAKLKQAEAAAKAGHPEYFTPEWIAKQKVLTEQNKGLHAAVLAMAQDPSLSPQERASLTGYADWVASTPTVEHKYEELEKVRKDPLELENLKASTKLKTAMTGEVGKAKPELGITEGGEVIEMKPGVKAPGAHKLGGPTRETLKTYVDPRNPAATVTINEGAGEKPPTGWVPYSKPAAGKGAKTDADLDKQILQKAKAAYAGRPFMKKMESFEDFQKEYRAKRLPELRAEAGIGGAAGRGPTPEDLSSLPPGAKLDTKPNLMTGHPDAILPDGRHVPWVPE